MCFHFWKENDQWLLLFLQLLYCIFLIFFVIGNNLNLCIIFNLVVLVPVFCHLWFSSLLTSVILMIFRFYFIPFFKVIFSYHKADWVWFSRWISSPLPFLIAFGIIYSPHFDVNCVKFLSLLRKHVSVGSWLPLTFNSFQHHPHLHKQSPLCLSFSKLGDTGLFGLYSRVLWGRCFWCYCFKAYFSKVFIIYWEKKKN